MVFSCCMKKFLYVLILILLTSCSVQCEDVILPEENVVHEEEIKQDSGSVPDDSVLEVDTPHEEIIETPELLNEDPLGNAWLVKIESDAEDVEFKDLLDYSDYKEEVGD